MAAIRFQLGPVASWVAAIGTVGAFVFAALVYWWDLRRRRDGLRKSQAISFDAWIIDAQIRPNEDTDLFPGQLFLGVDVGFYNASQQAIRDVNVGMRYREESFGSFPVGVIPPATQGKPETRAFKSFALSEDLLTEIGPLGRIMEIETWFTDAAGNRWTRKHKGELKLVRAAT